MNRGMPKLQLHVSGLLMMEGCGEAYRRRYIEGERLLPGVAALVGTGVHQTVRADLYSKFDTGRLLFDTEIKDLARDNFAGAWDKQGVILAADDAIRGAKVVKGEATDKTIRLARLHHCEVALGLLPTHPPEREFVLDVDGLGIQLAGTIDVQEATTIRDTKTSSKSPPETAAQESLQLTAYALAVKASDGVMPKTGILDYLVDTKIPKKVQPSREFHEADFLPFFARLEAAVRAIEKGVFVPARPDHWACRPAWCGFFDTCRYALRPVSVGLVNIDPIKEDRNGKN